MKANSNSEIIEEDLKSTKKLCNQPLFQEYQKQCYMDAGAKIWYKMGIFWVRDCFQSRVNSCRFLLHPSMLIPQLHNLWLTKKGYYSVMLYLIIFCFFLCFLLVCVACVALGVFWVRDWFQSRMNSCRILLYPPAQIPQLHNLWLTKKGHHIVMLCLLFFFSCMVHYKRKWMNSTVKQLICYILKSNKCTV